MVTTPLSSSSSLEAYQSFDTVVGAIEDVAVGAEFQALQSFYLSKYWKEFEGDENSECTHEQFVIFQNYSKEMAHLIETHVKRHLGDDFSFSNFIERWYGTLEEPAKEEDNATSSITNASRDLIITAEDCSTGSNHENGPSQSFHMTCEIEVILKSP